MFQYPTAERWGTHRQRKSLSINPSLSRRAAIADLASIALFSLSHYCRQRKAFSEIARLAEPALAKRRTPTHPGQSHELPPCFLWAGGPLLPRDLTMTIFGVHSKNIQNFSSIATPGKTM